MKANRTVGIGGARYTIEGRTATASAKANRSIVRGKLTTRGLGLLKRRKSLTATVEVTVVWEAVTTKRRISITLAAPKSARRG